MKFASIWKGPDMPDGVEHKDTPESPAFSYTWFGTGLYALDDAGRPWTLCRHISWSVGKRTRPNGHAWFLVDDLLSGAAARDQAEAPPA